MSTDSPEGANIQERTAGVSDLAKGPSTTEPNLKPAGLAGFTESLGPAGRRYLLTLGVVTLILAQPWIVLIRGAGRDELYSYAVLIPAICVWLIRQRVPVFAGSACPSRVAGMLLFAVATLCASSGIAAWRSGWIRSETSWLTVQMAAWVLGVWGASAYHLGFSWMRRHAFAIAFLVFAIPVPTPLVEALELGLQAASATASDWLFALSGTPYLRDGMAFWLPNIHILVAPECSGIRSTLVLLITGILGAHLLLKNPVHQLCVVLVILPLGVFRNAIRILTLTLLSVHVNPEIMNSALHKRGGPLFFAVSLIPLFAMFWWFGRRERRARPSR
jgi:exosortase